MFSTAPSKSKLPDWKSRGQKRCTHAKAERIREPAVEGQVEQGKWWHSSAKSLEAGTSQWGCDWLCRQMSEKEEIKKVAVKRSLGTGAQARKSNWRAGWTSKRSARCRAMDKNLGKTNTVKHPTFPSTWGLALWSQRCSAGVNSFFATHTVQHLSRASFYSSCTPEHSMRRSWHSIQPAAEADCTLRVLEGTNHPLVGIRIPE